MKLAKKIISIMLTGAFLLSLSSCELISKTEEGKLKEAVAKINGHTITKAEYLKRFETKKAQIQAFYGSDFFEKKENENYVTQIKQDLLENMINEVLLVKRAEELKVVPDEKTIQDEVNKNIEESKKTLGGEDKFNKTLSDLKITLEDYKAYIRNQVIIEKLYDHITKDVNVTEDEIKKYYNENIYDYTEKPNKMNVSHILVKTQDEANKVKAELDKGVKFEEVAKKYSQDPGSKDKGGNLGDIYYNDKNYDKDFMANAIALPVGKISGPVKTQSGYHIIKVNSKEEYKQIPLEKVKGDIEKKLIDDKKEQAFEQELNNLRKKAKIKIYYERL
ncbi:peptidylprolyl isomerase [Thermobrachium celere]|uniref:peptidylprolyl isomerase n=1 Tax=Thermobrachium celere DSM 8682 TaxID=941824 RepID=R7RSD4_9CLOT|nr:peptidylprolyl isomerase [Thermobrachium celere]CDF59087.1 Foldase protein PrsA precursor [Thermobrachium celere DSM 8682]